MTRRRPPGDRLLRLLLRLLPQEFRGDYGEAMAADFAESRADGRRVAWRRELPALLATAAREHASVLGRDLQYALRMLRRTPGFTALAVAMLAIGTGANVAMFTVIDAVMLRSPFADPDRLAVVRVEDANGRLTSAVPYDQFERLAASPRSLAAVAALASGSHLLTGSGDARRPDLECVTASMFDVLGARPFLGRTFTADEDRAGAPATIVLSHQFWQELGRPADALGTSLTLNGTPVTVIGVMPRGFAGAYSRGDTSGWLPLGVTLTGGGLTGCRAGGLVNVFARVRDRLSLREAEAALPGFHLLSLEEGTFESLRRPFLSLAAAVGCVLLIACLNVGGLQMERAIARRREMALRLALGASRARLLRQTLTENIVLALAGAAGGVAATVVTLRGLVSLLPANLPHLSEIEVNGRVLLAAMAAATAAGLLSAVIPALQSGRFTPARDLAGAGRAATRAYGWTRRGLVVAGIALSIVVLIAAGLMIQTFLILRPSRPGFDSARKLATLVRLPGMSDDASAQFFDRLFDRVRTIPGVRGVSGSSYLPMASTVAISPVTLRETTANAFGAVITPDYLAQMKIPVVAGRAFTANDTARSAPVAIVNELFAARLRPGGSVIGERVLAAGPRRRGEPAIERQIVGVIANTRSRGGDTRPASEFYVPYAQSPIPLLYLIVETDARHEVPVAAGIRQAIRALHPTLVVEPVEPLRAMLDRRVGTPRLGAWLLGIFAGMAVALAAVGLMTTIGWWVSQRTRELGVRLALGASRAQVTRLVLGQGMALGAMGVGAGCLLAAGVTRYLRGWIYGVAPMDGLTFAGAAALMLVVAAFAICVPLRRALTIDPVVALRAD
jgi:putative ABC transport system permease protein